MPKWKPARGKKKTETSRAGAIGCALAIAVLLALFIWFFAGALRPS